MKKILLAVTFILSTITISAQPPMGGGMGGSRGDRPPGGGRGGNRPPMHNQGQTGDEFMIMGIPDIPDLTLEQREKLSKEITNERKDISKLMQKKRELTIDAENPGLAEKERQKLIEKMAKIDEDVKKKEGKYDKKYRSILSENQYKTFNEKKKDIQFKGKENRGSRPQGRDRQQPPAQFPDGMTPLDMPGEDMF